MKKSKCYLKFVALSAVSLTTGILALTSIIDSGAMNEARSEALTNCEEGIFISQIDGWTSGSRHSGVNFSLDANSKVTPTINTALVIDYENLSITDNYVSFYLNSFETTNRINDTNKTPKGNLYLFNGEDHVKTYEVSTGTADIFVKNSSIGTYNKMVIKLSDFNGVFTENYEMNLNSLFYSTRLNLSNLDRTKSDIKGIVKGIYVCEFGGEGTKLDLSSATKVYTPKADNFFSASGVGDLTQKYLALRGVHAVPTTYDLSSDSNGILSLDDKIFIGGSATLSVIPNNYSYILDTLTVNDLDVTAQVVGNKYTVDSIPTTGIIAYATFKEATPISVVLNDDGNGFLSADKDFLYQGESLEISINPIRYFELDVLTVNGVNVTSEVVDGKYIIESLSLNELNAFATFKKAIDFTGTNGRVDFVPFENGGETVLTFVPDVSYEIEEVKVSGITVSLNQYNKVKISNATKPLNVYATFVKAVTFNMDEGSLFSVNNNKLGNTYALWDSVNVKTAVTLENTTNQYVGITLNGLNKQISGSENIVIHLQNTDSSSRTFYVDINGQQAESVEYYLLDRLGNFITKTGVGSSVGTYARFQNATFNSTYDKEGYEGLIILPLTRYGVLETIDSISIRTPVTDISRARFNVGSIYLDTSLNAQLGWIDSLSEANLVWKPSATNWTTYETPAAEEGQNPINYTELYTRTSFIEAGTMVYGLKDEVTPASPNYDTFHGTFPQNMIGEDGYVDLKTLGVKGMIFDVENPNIEQVQFAIRIAGAENTSLTDTTLPLWQTSSSSAGRYAQVIYENGVVQNRGSKYLPVAADGNFKGSMYIPLSDAAFTKISQDSGGFPEKIQPVFRVLFADPKDYWIDYTVKITNFRFITDDTPYQTSAVTLTGPDCNIDAKVGELSVQNDANNHLLAGTELIFQVDVNIGYHIIEVTYAEGGIETILTPNSNGEYSVIVNADIVISVKCEANIYAINYNLDGGINSEFNPASYEYAGLPIELEDPTKEGYKFLGWIDDNGEEVTDINTFAAKDYNLTARWQKNSVLSGIDSNTTTIIIVSSVAVALVAGGVITIVVIKRKKGK